MFVDCDVELIVSGRSRHSREEVDDGRHEIVGHCDWDVGRKCRDGRQGEWNLGKCFRGTVPRD